MGQYLSSMDWPTRFTAIESCEDMLNVFYEVIHTGLDLLLLIKKVCFNTLDTVLIKQHLKSLIMERRKAFHKLGMHHCNTSCIGTL